MKEIREGTLGLGIWEISRSLVLSFSGLGLKTRWLGLGPLLKISVGRVRPRLWPASANCLRTGTADCT
jgi:hypothetical protein